MIMLLYTTLLLNIIYMQCLIMPKMVYICQFKPIFKNPNKPLKKTYTMYEISKIGFNNDRFF